jgi:nicotinate-nucleotide pyrophosphorylase (carboxylating)
MTLTPLPTLLVEPIVRQALIEDLGRAGDITSDAIAPADRIARTVMASREAGVVAACCRPSAWRSIS